MGKSWDKSGIAFQKETWEKCFEALKPGGYLLAFGGSRTFHRIAVAIEDAGFEIPFGRFDAGDVDDINYMTTVFECEYWRVV